MAKIGTMDDSMAQPQSGLAAMELPGWKTALSWTAAFILAILFLASGIWKIVDAHGWAVRVAQAKVPQALSLPAAILVGITETMGGVLILVPRFRRWGAFLIGLLLTVFLVYFAINYSTLRGEDCSCFPWLKRVVGPGFFIGDGAMLLGALVAWVWAKPAAGLRTVVLILGAVSVFAAVSYGVAAVRQSGTKAPDTITVDGRPYSLQQGKIFLFYFDPECMHCFDAAKRMSKMNWGDTKVVGLPIQNPQFAPAFLQDTGLRAAISTDAATLRKIFPFVSAPAGVALENGREKAPLTQFEADEPGATLKKLGFIY
jgi:uncharacterized membrane protein YphA (DoxX/SURF4 family)